MKRLKLKVIFNDNNKFSSEKQQFIAIASAGAFFRVNVGIHADPKFNNNFNPYYWLPESITKFTQVGRDFAFSLGSQKIKVIDDFNAGNGENNLGFSGIARNVSVKQRLPDENGMTEQNRRHFLGRRRALTELCQLYFANIRLSREA